MPFEQFLDLNASGLIILSDNGSQLTLKGYERHIRSLGIKRKMIYSHTPEDDGHIESCLVKFREDYIHTSDFINCDEFSDHIDLTINNYNTVTPNSSLKYLKHEELETDIMN